MRRAAAAAFVVLSTLLLLAALWAFRGAVVLFVLSIVVGAALRPLVDRLVHEGWSLKLAIAAVYLAAVGAVLAIVFILGAEILVEVPLAAKALAQTYERAAVEWPHADGFRRFVAERLPPPDELYAAAGRLDAGDVAREALNSSFGLLGLLGQLLVVIALAIYWSVDRDAFERLWLSLLPVESRTRARAVWTAARVATGAILRQELGQSVVAAVALAPALWCFGCEYWGIAALAVALLRLVPLLGLVLAVASAAALGLGTGVTQAVLAGGGTAAVLLALRAVRGRLFDAPRLNPILHVLTVLGLAQVYGPAGLVVAPLVTAGIQAIVGQLASTHQAATAVPTLAELHRRAAEIDRAALVLPLTPELHSVVDRLKRLLARAEAG